MYTIGQFSRITQVSARMLRHYDEIGLLKPDYVDDETMYRYYTAEQIGIATKIFLFREMDFPLKEIERILLKIAQDESIDDILNQHKSRIEKRLEKEKELLMKIDSVLKSDKELIIMANEIKTKTTEPLLIASVRKLGTYNMLPGMIRDLQSTAKDYISGPPIYFCHDKEFKTENADLEVAWPIKKHVKIDGVDVREMPATKVIYTTHVGPYNELGKVYKIMFDHVMEKGYKVVSAPREFYITDPEETEPEKSVTELQFPIN